MQGRGVGESGGHPSDSAGGGLSHGPAPTRDPPPTQPLTWVLSLALPSCEMGRRQRPRRGECSQRGLWGGGGQGICIPWEHPGPQGCGEEGSPPHPAREGSGGRSGIATRPGKSFPTWAG